MKHGVILKSYKQGINLILDGDEEFETLLKEIGDKFRESADFFKEAKIALSIEGRELSQEEEIRVMEVIQENSSVKVRCLIGKDEENKAYARALEEIERRFPTPEERLHCQIYPGNITGTIQVKESLLILGDVEEDALVVSDGSVLVMGALRGEVFCGANSPENQDSFVVALDFAPTRIKIGPYRVSDKELKGKQRLGWRKSKGAMAAFVDKEQEKILVEPVDSTWLAGFFQ